MSKENDDYFLGEHLNDEAVAIYAEAFINEHRDKIPSSVLDHVEDCFTCKKEILSVYQIIREDARLNKINPTIKISYAVKIAAGIALLFGLGFLTYYLIERRQDDKIAKVNTNKPYYSNPEVRNNNENTSAQYTQNSTSKSSGKIDNSLAENTKESQLFEGLINSNYRSTEVIVSVPQIGQQFKTGEAVSFTIKSSDASKLFWIELYNNKEKRILQTNTFAAPNFLLKDKLSPGLYYWKLLADDNLLYVGKIIVR